MKCFEPQGPLATPASKCTQRADFPSGDEILQGPARYAERAGDVISGTQGQDRYRCRVADQPSRDFTDRAIASRNRDHVSWVF